MSTIALAEVMHRSSPLCLLITLRTAKTARYFSPTFTGAGEVGAALIVAFALGEIAGQTAVADIAA